MDIRIFPITEGHVAAEQYDHCQLLSVSNNEMKIKSLVKCFQSKRQDGVFVQFFIYFLVYTVPREFLHQIQNWSGKELKYNAYDCKISKV